ncbi:MAG: TonB-dependent receptor [Pseudomonadales bacterium]
MTSINKNNRGFNKLLTSLIAVPMCFSLGSFAAAQETKSLQLEEVVVTSRKREESVQDVPIAVTAITSELQNGSIRDLKDLEGLVPNVQIRQSMGRAAGHAISIRGIGYSNDEKSFDPAVGVVLDGVAMTVNTGALFDNFDIEKVEIARGPQGTLFGKNTIAGVISVQRSDPTGELGGKVSATVGNFGRSDVKAIFNTPLIEDVLAAKLFVSSLKTDGNIYNVTLDKDTNKQDYMGYGVKFLFTPNDDLEVKLTVEKIDDGSDNGAFRNLSGMGGNRTIALQDGYSGGWEPFNPLVSVLTGPNAADFRQANYKANATNPEINGSACLMKNDPGSTEDTTSAAKENVGQVDTDAITLQATYQVGENSSLTYIYGYRDTYEEALWPYSGSACDFITIDNRNWNDQESHELRFNTSGENYDLVMGVYQMDNSYTQDWFTYDFWELVRTPALLQSMYGATDAEVARLGNDFGQNIYQNQDSSSSAIYGQLDYQVSDRLELTLGLRYTKDEKDFNARGFCIEADSLRDQVNWDTCVHGKGQTGAWDISESKTTWKLGMAYNLNEDTLAYASISTGFHSGGFYGKNQRLIDYAVTYKPEEITSGEFGIKTDFNDGRSRLNAAIFHSTVEDLQAMTTVQSSDGTAVSIAYNVGEVEYAGLELEYTQLFSESFQISATMGYLDASYNNFDANLANVDYNGDGTKNELDYVDNSYLDPKQAPELTFGVSATNTADYAGGLIISNLSYSWTDDFYTQEDNDPVSLVESYGKLHLNFAFEKDSYKVALFVNNLTDETNWVSRTTSTLITYGQQTQGRAFGIEFQTEF